MAGSAAAGMEMAAEGEVRKTSVTMVEPQATLNELLNSQAVESISKTVVEPQTTLNELLSSQAVGVISMTAAEPQATLSELLGPQVVERIANGGTSDGAIQPGVEKSGVEKRKQLGLRGRVVICFLRKFSPVKVLRKFRDCYVSTLGSCAQSYSSYPPYGLMSCQASPLHPTLRMAVRSDDLHGSEFCLSPAFMMSFNELVMKGSGAFQDSDPGASPLRKSFSDFESCVRPQMKRTDSDAAALYCRSPGNSRSVGCRRSSRSPGWTPTRAVGGQAMMIFPIQEDPELILASFRKEAQELKLASFRKEAQELKLASFRKESTELDLSLKEDGELSSLTEGAITVLPSLPVKEAPEACDGSTLSLIAV